MYVQRIVLPARGTAAGYQHNLEIISNSECVLKYV